MTGTGRVLTAVSFMGPVTISSCSEIRETEREREMGRNREFSSRKVYEVHAQVKKKDTQGRAEQYTVPCCSYGFRSERGMKK